MALQLITAPAVEPLTKEEVKDFLRVTHNADDELINSLITAARTKTEDYLRRALIEQVWRLSMTQFPCGDEAIELPRGPLISIEAFTYTNTSGGTTTMVATTDYLADTSAEPGRVVPDYGKSWPTAREIPNAVKIEFKAGYGDAGTDVPAAILQAMRLFVSHFYDRRESVALGTIAVSIPGGAESLLDPYRLYAVPA